MSGLRHIFTVDVEEYFQVHAFESSISRFRWGSYPSRVEYSVGLLLDMLAKHNTCATFFTLGWIAHNHPHIIRRISDAGHEVASHGWWHQNISRLTRSEFRHDVRIAKQCLEDITGRPVLGFRAPSFSITPGKEWVFDELLNEGYGYDSSLFPINRPGYSTPGASPVPHLIERPNGHLMEFPLATTVWNGVRLPAAGGGYFRHLPYALTRRAFREHTEGNIPGVFYIHPWELDPEQPRLRGTLCSTLRHYRGLRSTGKRLGWLLNEFKFTSVESYLKTVDIGSMQLRPAVVT
jgi:polysaccharide deacetylase family protein (PEP-CTERM system associated)